MEYNLLIISKKYIKEFLIRFQNFFKITYLNINNSYFFLN